MKIIDAHCLAGDPAGAAGLIESMQKNGVDKTVICPEDRCTAVYNDEGNRFIKDMLSKYPDKYYGFAVANPWYGSKARETLESFLSDGFNGVYFHPVIQGFTINDEMVFPLIELCEKYGAPVYFHTGTPVQALPFQVLSLARRYPKVNFIIGHMGANDYIGDAFASAEQSQNIYLETGFTLTFSMASAAQKYTDRVVFGSGAPRSVQEFELSKLRAAVSDPIILEKILAKNIMGILGGKNDHRHTYPLF